MSHKAISFTALAASLVALALSAVNVVASNRGSRSDHRAASPGMSELGALREEVGSLRAEIASLSRRRDVVAPAYDGGDEPSSGEAPSRMALEAGTRADGESDDTLQRLQELEHALERVENRQRQEENRPPIQLFRGLAGVDDPAAVTELQLQAMDWGESAERRLQALRTLRHSRDAFGNDARSSEVVTSMLELAASSDDPKVRADVFRQLSGLTEPAMKEPLLAALQGDASVSVRGEAIETLADFLPDPAAELALRNAAENEDSPKLREEALEYLEEYFEEAKDRSGGD